MRIIMLIVAVLAMAGCQQEPPPPGPDPVRPIKIHTVGDGEYAGRSEFSGVLSSAQQAEVAFEVSGRLIELDVIEGQGVERGEELARLDPRDYRAARDAAQARADNAESQYRRIQELVDRGVASQQEGDNARQNLDVARAELDRAAKALDDSVLIAPFSGQVAVVHVENFQNVRAKVAIIDLVDVDSLEIKIDVPENLIARSRPDLTVEERDALIQARVTVSGIEGREFEARLKEFSQTADPATRTYRATFAFDKPADVNVLPGMTARLRVQAPVDDGVQPFVPEQAVRADAAGASMVWIVGDDLRVTARLVSLGEMRGDRVAVLDGLARGERIALSGVHDLREGMQVREFGL